MLTATLISAFLMFGDPAPQLMGHATFCVQRPAECESQPISKKFISRENIESLAAVNRMMNHKYIAQNDIETYGTDEFWTYPTRQYADCEDYALIKRKYLVDHGFDPSNLLLTYVVANKVNHIVLVARTIEGDLVLDNLIDEIKPWYATGYDFKRIQRRDHSGRWRSIVK